jgi:hypothetical protein
MRRDGEDEERGFQFGRRFIEKKGNKRIRIRHAKQKKMNGKRN